MARHGGAPGNLVWRANGQGMRWQVNLTGGSDGAQYTRSRHYSNVPFRYARFVLPTAYTTNGPPVADADLPNPLTYQLGVEYPFNAAFSGIPNRPAATFGGANTASYAGPGTNPSGYIVSDVVDFGSTVPPGTYFGLHTVAQNTGALTTASLPWQAVASDNYASGYERYTGYVATQTDLIAANTALTASSVTPVASTQGGAQTIFTPSAMLILVDAHYRCIVGPGDSITYGVNEGDLGSGNYGDSMGSKLGNAGIAARWVNETLGYNYVNMGRGSDAFSYYSAANWRYRLQFMTLANPTHIACGYGHNDIGASIALATLLTDAQACHAGMRTACPGVPILQMALTLNTTSTDSFATTANQTPTGGFGGSASLRGQFNDTYVRANGSALGNAGFFDPNTTIEYGYAEGVPSSETGLFNATGAANGWTQDGTHLNSYGYAQVALGMICGRNGVQVTDPFAQ
jgi:lysophospholipase L1-like esterase